MMTSESLLADLAQVRQELEMFKAADPRRAVEIAIGLAVERKKVGDAIAARDAAVQRLGEAYVSLRQKIAIIERLHHDPYKNEPSQEELATQAEIDALKGLVADHEETMKALREELRVLKEREQAQAPPPKYEDKPLSNNFDLQVPGLLSLRLPRGAAPPVLSRCPSTASVSSVTTENHSIRPSYNKENGDLEYAITRAASQYSAPAIEAEETIDERNRLLAAIPLPMEAPEDTLRPILLPPSMTLQELLATAPPPLRTLLANYRVLQQLTTSWCPNREEHGYTLTPTFKCTTNPRVATAHRWTAVDVLARLNKPTECFYNRDGTWYYAGVYKAFRLDDLTSKEWEALSNETVQAVIKETLAGRKNISPQTIYETSQLYSAGALKVACIALQCVGFNKLVYQAVLDQADKCCTRSSGLGIVGSTWNAAIGAKDVGIVDGMAGLLIGTNNKAE